MNPKPEPAGQLVPPIRRPPTAVGTATLPPPRGRGFQFSEYDIVWPVASTVTVGVLGLIGSVLANISDDPGLRLIGLIGALTAVSAFAVPLAIVAVCRWRENRRVARWMRG